MKVNICLGTNDKNWILWDMARYIKDYNDDIEIEISAQPLEGYDVYHINNDEMFDYPNIPWHRALYTCHQFERDNKRRTFWAREPAIRQARRVGCVCKEYMEILNKQGVNPEKVYYTPAGVDVDKFQPNYDRKWKENDELVIGYVGRKYESGRKGEDLLREILLSFHSLRRIKIIFLGDNRDEEVEFCKSIGVKCEYYQRGKNIEYEDYPKIYSEFDCLLITSREEGGPVPALEALSCGVPVITTPVGVTKDIYSSEPTKNCYFYNTPQDAKRIIADIILARDRELKDVANGEIKKEDIDLFDLTVKSGIRDTILDLPYTWERWAQVHRAIYEDIYNEIKDQILIEDYMPPSQLEHIGQRYSQLAKEQIDPNHLSNFLKIQDEARKGQGILGTKNIFEGKPAIIVGFGPSLDKHLDLLNEYQDNFVVISSDAVFPTLFKHNISPDFVFVGDWTAKQAHNFKINGDSNGDHIDLNEQNVVLPTIVHPEVIQEVNKSPDCPVFWYNVFDPGSQLMNDIPNIVGKKGGILAGVLTTGMCWSFAAGLGCSPIIFIGHDLYYPMENGVMQGYSKHASDEKRKYQEQTKFKMDLISFPDINGNIVITHLTFASFYKWINHTLKVKPYHVINASEQGILHGEHIEQMEFKDVCSQYGKEDLSTEKKNKIKKAWYYNASEELII